ncbi:cupin domain-containing protein [Actinoplanes sp. NPDC048791]|uniref:cupin domain-containing protein n=1 Tax=Actinoplanes sp. NPDC048791 TaxID=3154623 RepID=UPI0033F55968
MTIVVEFPPGDPGSPPHRHPGPAFGLVLEGEMVFELEGEPARVVRAGKRSGSPAATSSTTGTATTATTSPCGSPSPCCASRVSRCSCSWTTRSSPADGTAGLLTSTESIPVHQKGRQS